MRAIPPKGESSVAAFEVALKNSGNVSGKEIVQRYVGSSSSQIERPNKELKKFDKVSLAPGESKKVIFELSERDLSFWNVETNTWQVEPAEYIFSIGSSATDIKETVSVWLG